MPKYIVDVEFRVTGRFEIEAQSESKAKDQAFEKSVRYADSLRYEDAEDVTIVGTVEEVARMERQRKILAEQRRV